MATRFRVLVNGFAEQLFSSLPLMANAVPAKGVDSPSCKIYDKIERQFVANRSKRRNVSSAPGSFSVRVKGYCIGMTFASLDEAAEFISDRPPESDFAVFENEICVFMAHFSHDQNLSEAL